MHTIFINVEMHDTIINTQKNMYRPLKYLTIPVLYYVKNSEYAVWVF